MNFIADVGTALSAADVEQQTIDDILTTLAGAEESVLKGEKMKPVPASSFGAADTATMLEMHTGKAHAHVVDAMAAMVSALKTYSANVRHFRDDAHETDADIGAAMSRNRQVVESTSRAADCFGSNTPDTFQDTSCSVPGSDA